MVEFMSSGPAQAELLGSDVGVVENDAGRSEVGVKEQSLLSLVSGDSLFREGDAKSHVYRVESGIFCLTAQRPSGPPRVVEMVFPGGFLGFGFLENHIHSAMAVVPSRVRLFRLSEISDLCEQFSQARERQALATEREFAARRRQLVGATENSPLARVAAFLSAVSHFNESEGRDPHSVTGTLKSGEVASFLGLDVETLAVALNELQERGLITRNAEGGLVLLDPVGLEEMAPSP